MSTPVLKQLDAELHKRKLYQDVKRVRLAQLASQQERGANALDRLLSGLGDLLISMGSSLKEQHFVDPAPKLRFPDNGQAGTRIIKM